jgi:uncharacterized glyoxalase superfamily protein PhnB
MKSSFPSDTGKGFFLVFVVPDIASEFDYFLSLGIKPESDIITTSWGESYFRVSDENDIFYQISQRV